MIRSVTVTNWQGERLELDLFHPETSGFIVEEISGISPGKTTIHVTELSTADGAFFNSARFPSRSVNLVLRFMARPDIETIRRKCYQMFAVNQKIRIAFQTDSRSCEIYGHVESNESDIFSKYEGARISVICPDPFFYSINNGGTVTSVFSGVDAGFEFDFGNESTSENMIEFGQIKNNQEECVFYSGEHETGVTIRIHALAMAQDITIYNVRTRERMFIDTGFLEKITGSVILAGDDIIICTVKGKKSATLVRDGETKNILNCVIRGSDWFQLRNGDNIFAYVAKSGGESLNFSIEHTVVYEGI